MAKTVKYYWFVFADGYAIAVRGLSAQERRVLEVQHGKLQRKTLAS